VHTHTVAGLAAVQRLHIHAAEMATGPGQTALFSFYLQGEDRDEQKYAQKFNLAYISEQKRVITAMKSCNP